ncbi:MAG: hypothetical protein A2469_04770 [Candidatus Magasanikbacteria bacterium RIFOXYC2_FULL_40_16]|uniref:Metalloenzyme domain-containing protein n=3 Tax=Candidatus Magasanikiibacteriota TaxID=1752731 RepID=A0A1F6NDK6_9BACT|nr:MAG: hypothetical protein A2224_00515 [Candidatus Magasanikbacteria bacterium RIFOXYA2_FULL_40_20]OGH81911.1 MAG: hypothetical protein A2373_04320 [Candidatus Magasanikbacteria bacterium RIFOXYB1_FULL_40_15]OGH87335.1 MAG: hypothetical protein A2206_02065 [Candidatus Magasanikbacteria bacterium RIFOXYA1_FULL_40_8]OGH89347.1 MAG: hypothetical protein A2469_04770 [Candidatus Magasanikbacteria bacterium RIFOXYC2_FULL_40_16]
MRNLKVIFIVAICVCSFNQTSEAKPHRKKPKVLFISIDGWHASLAEEMPAVKELMENGSWTLEAEAPIPPITVVSHAVIFTGAVPEKNGVVRYEPKRVKDWWPLKVRTVFQAVHIRNKKTAAFVQKLKVAAVLPSKSVDEFGLFRNKKKIVDNACAAINSDEPVYSLVFAHIEDLDATGHEYGWLSPEQKIAALSVDKAIADLAYCARWSEKKSGIPVVMIIFGDHGGHRKTHGAAIKSDLQVPWIAVGAGIKAGYKIKGKVRLLDITPTILKILGQNPAILLPEAEGKIIKEIFTR